MSTTLLLIDVQNDFHPGGSLAIPTAMDDANRTVAFITKHSSSISRIVCTMDSHHLLHIANPKFWTSSEDTGSVNPAPFTIITMEDIKNGVWIPRKEIQPTFIAPTTVIDPKVFDYDCSCSSSSDTSDSSSSSSSSSSFDIVKYCTEYTRRLEEKGRFQLCIWPEHCLLGTQGHGIVPKVMEAMHEWCAVTGGSIEFIYKGQTLYTEMYSALSAEVPVNTATSFNTTAHQQLLQTKDNKLVICGQALSHCVNYTVRDIVEHWPKDEMNKITLLQDCCSSVPGFEAAGDTFLQDMKNIGINVLKSTDD